jgi:hypothetical protein
MVEFANSRAALPIDPTSAFPTESDEIERTPNGVRFLWMLTNSNGCTSGQYLDDSARSALFQKYD